jgi:hypothetical protein
LAASTKSMKPAMVPCHRGRREACNPLGCLKHCYSMFSNYLSGQCIKPSHMRVRALGCKLFS